MGRRVFISFLGTGFYERCRYRGKTSVSDTRFVQCAVLSDIGAKEWCSEDITYILLTEKAEKLNWKLQDNVRSDRNGNSVKYEGLYDELKSLSFPFSIEGVRVEDGGTEEMIWKVFSSVYKLIQPGDALYFDLTHAFRYLPMLILVLGNYSKYLKNTRVVSMSYGNYENRNLQTGETPIVDLMPLVELQDWSYSAAAFIKTGKVGSLVDFMKAQSNGGDIYDQMANGLDEFEKEIETCRGIQIVEGKSICCKVIPSMKKTIRQSSAPLKEILQTVNSEVKDFGRNSFDNVCRTIEWCRHFGQYQQAYTLCQEGIITKICNDIANYSPYDLKTKDGRLCYRNYWSAVLGVSDEVASNELAWKEPLSTNTALTRCVLNENWVKELRAIYADLTIRRNQINHAGFLSRVEVNDLIAPFNDIVDACLDFMRKDQLTICYTPQRMGKRLFINYSNHPSCFWSDKQKDAAKEYGDEIIDFDFYKVDPVEDNIRNIAESECKKILGYAEEAELCVHVMGEMTLTFAIVTLLKDRGARCLASTACRNVIEFGDGRKESEFDFVRFREY